MTAPLLPNVDPGAPQRTRMFMQRLMEYVGPAIRAGQLTTATPSGGGGSGGGIVGTLLVGHGPPGVLAANPQTLYLDLDALDLYEMQ